MRKPAEPASDGLAEVAAPRKVAELIGIDGENGPHPVLRSFGLREIAAKHKGKTDLVSYLAGKIKSGGSGVYGAVPMPPQPQVSEADAKALVSYILSLN